MNLLAISTNQGFAYVVHLSELRTIDEFIANKNNNRQNTLKVIEDNNRKKHSYLQSRI